jgi:hypothetical protein
MIQTNVRRKANPDGYKGDEGRSYEIQMVAVVHEQKVEERRDRFEPTFESRRLGCVDWPEGPEA